MEHFYQNVNSENWFGYEDLYSSMVSKFGDNSHFVEVGTWKGMSATYMAVEIINSGKDIKFDCVDTWDFVETSSEITKNQFDNLYEIFITNIEPVKHKIGIVKTLSWDGAKNYPNNSLDFVFIDAGHDYESVTKDLNAWYPKIKNGGIIAGHDYHWNVGVYPAVNDFFKGKNIRQMGACWIVEKEEDLELNVIWQTQNGDQTTFEYDYLNEILLKKLKFNKFFDNSTFNTIKNNSIIVYSTDQSSISEDFKNYLKKFEENGFNYYLFHLSNESLNHDCSYYDKAKHVFRNYYDVNIKQENVTFVPLGIKSGFLSKSENSITNKKYDFCFIGQPKSDRFELLDILEKMDNVFIHKTLSWNCKTSMSQDECIKIYSDSKFVPCPMGWQHPDSFRIMESLESGSIPILKKYNNCEYFDKVWGNSPIPFVESWIEIEIFKNMENESYSKLFSDVSEWYREFKKELSLKIKNIIKNEK